MKKFRKITNVFLALLMIFGLLVIDVGVKAEETLEVTCIEETTTTYKNFELTKLDSLTDNPISGVTFAFSKNQTNLEEYLTTGTNKPSWKGDDKVTEKITNTSGKISCWLNPGTWYYAEIEADGYIVDSSIQVVTTTSTSRQLKVFKNISYGKLRIVKLDQNESPLNGAKFTLTLLGNEGEPDTIIEENFVVNGEITFNQLIPGRYKVVETEAPSGYDLDPTPQFITIEPYTKEGTIFELTFINTPTPPVYGFLVITKYNVGKTITLQGAEFGVYTDLACLNAVEGSPFTTGIDGKTSTLTLIPGTYYIKELVAPAGYTLDQRIATVVITAGLTTSYEMENEITPPTAGNYASTLLIGLFLAAFTALSYACFKFTKKRVNR
jgi:uncharacterized surface anchored protein